MPSNNTEQNSFTDDEEEDEVTHPMIPSSQKGIAYNSTNTGKNTPGESGKRDSNGARTVSISAAPYPTKMMQNNRPPALSEKQPAPTGMMAWVGFGCCVMALASLSVSFCSPYWLQTWPMSENKFKNIGLWHVCFHDYMQFKDDSQQIYDGCWWVFDSRTKYYKLREWLTPPWFISCQVLTTGCLLVEIATALVTGFIFLHFCPVMNHEYLQTYGIFASASMMFLVTMISFVVAIVFGVQCNDRYWLPRPDQNFLSWGFGFLIISAIFALASGVCLFMEGQKTYDALLRKEDEYTKAALEMSTYPLEQSSYPPVYEPAYGPGYGEPSYGPMESYAPNYGDKSENYGEKDGDQFRSFDKRPTSYNSDDDDRGGYPRYSSNSHA